MSGVVGTFASIVDFFSQAYQKIKDLINLLKNNPLTGFITGTSYESGFVAPSPDLGPVSFSSSIPGLTYEQFLRQQGNTVINVQGAIDPESVARQINDILTQSVGRGGGATNLGIQV